MRIDLRCPFQEKDQAKSLGARWDPAKKVWYIKDVEDLTPFMRWIKQEEEKTPPSGWITLEQYQKDRYNGECHALSNKAAKAFGIPLPLRSGWFKRHRKCIAQIDQLDDKPVKHKKVQKPKALQESFSTGAFQPLCDCDVPPWEDCEHTDAIIMKAMSEMLTCAHQTPSESATDTEPRQTP